MATYRYRAEVRLDKGPSFLVEFLEADTEQALMHLADHLDCYGSSELSITLKRILA